MERSLLSINHRQENTRDRMAYTPWVDPTQNEEVDDSQPFIHRVRFVDWSPSSISSIAITPDTWDPSSSFAVNSREQGGRGILAVGRANGNIELFGWIGGVSGSGSGKRSENFGGNGKGKGKGKLEGLAAGEKQGWVLLKVRLVHLFLSYCASDSSFLRRPFQGPYPRTQNTSSSHTRPSSLHPTYPSSTTRTIPTRSPARNPNS